MIKGCTMLALATLAAATACKSAPKPEAPPPRVDWGANDVETVSRAMVEELLESPELSYLSGTSADDLRVAAFSAGISNETSREIDHDGLMEAVERLLLASGRFRLVSEEDADAPAGGPRRAPSMGVDEARQRALDLGAEVAIHGTLRARRASQEEGGGRIFSLELSCLDLTGDAPLWTAVRQVSPSEGDLFIGD